MQGARSQVGMIGGVLHGQFPILPCDGVLIQAAVRDKGVGLDDPAGGGGGGL